MFDSGKFKDESIKRYAVRSSSTVVVLPPTMDKENIYTHIYKDEAYILMILKSLKICTIRPYTIIAKST